MKYIQPSVITSALLSGGLSLVSLVPMASASAPVQAADILAPLQAKLQQTRLSLSQAIDAAEAAVPGRAFEAQLDTHAGVAHYALELIPPRASMWKCM